MSSFLVSSETINSLAYMLKDETWKYHLSPELDMTPVTGEARRFINGFQSYEDLADWMTIMNLEALRQRYGQKAVIQDAGCVNLEAKPKKLSDIQFLKSLTCYLYQCAEGTVDESKFYRVLQDVRDSFPYGAITKTQAWGDAHWG